MVMLGPRDLGVKWIESLLSQSIRGIKAMEKESCTYSVARNMQWDSTGGKGRGLVREPLDLGEFEGHRQVVKEAAL